MNDTTVNTPSELEIRVERVFDAPRAHRYSVWTDPNLIPEWWGDATVVGEMDVRPGGSYRFQTPYGPVEGEYREVEPPERLVQTFQNHLQTSSSRTSATGRRRKERHRAHRLRTPAASGDAMSTATRTNTHSPALRVPDSHHELP
jgi:uncharacterized protein YndB with AHSA1/START domain